MEQAYYVGTDLKFKIELEADGFDQLDDEYEIKVVCGNKSQTITKEDIVTDGENFYMLIDTTQFGGGLVKVIVTAKVPDDDFTDDPWNGVRREVGVEELCYIKKP